MPTGYTAKIAEGMTFREYALGCARAFGALIEMRDEPNDVPIPDEFKPSDYHLDKFTEQRNRLAEFEGMSDHEANEQSKAEYMRALGYHHEGIKKDNALREKYERMLKEVEAFTPPSPEHAEYKEFMRSQIVESMRFDCGQYHEHELK
jgi:hypothetical protein